MHSGITRCLAVAMSAATLVAGCGARTGLLLDTPDATVDRGPDAPPPECVADRDCDDRVACTRDRCDVAAGRCAHAPVDATCDDRVFCDGVERCEVGVGCVAGAPVACDDGVACTRDRCDESARRCAASTDDALCPISHRCDGRRGCVARALANTNAGLFEIELPSGTLRPISGLMPFTDIALHPDRTLYAITMGGDLWRVDAATGASTYVAYAGQPFTALDAAPDGGLFAAGPNGLFRIGFTPRSATMVAAFPLGQEASGDIAFLGGRLLATAHTGTSTPDDLVEFDAAAGTVRTVGSVGYGCVWGPLAAFGETLYGLTCVGEVLRIDPATGAGSVLARSAVRFYGATAR